VHTKRLIIDVFQEWIYIMQEMIEIGFAWWEELASAKNKRKFLTFTSFEHAIVSLSPSPTIPCTINLYSFEIDS
jgi:hypothetical protein